MILNSAISSRYSADVLGAVISSKIVFPVSNSFADLSPSILCFLFCCSSMVCGGRKSSGLNPMPPC
ncbi:MAG: hypothetical protein P8Y23_16860 [Candidatus Lokiarchaeota archaeon]